VNTLKTKTLQFRYNSDFSGEILMKISIEKVEPSDYTDEANEVFVEIPFNELLALFAEYLRQRKIRQLEDLDPQALIDAMCGLTCDNAPPTGW
jgi:hypothetical protein